MPDERYNTAQEKRLVLLACADDLYPVLSTELKDQIQLIQVEDFSSAEIAFNMEWPDLFICGLDNNGRQFSPLIHQAAHHNIPVLAVASTETAAMEGVKWVLDRHEISAVVSLAKKLLDDPNYVPNNPSEYPPPENSGGNADETGVIVLQSTVISEKMEGNGSSADSPAESDLLTKQLEAQIRGYVNQAGDEFTKQLAGQAKTLSYLRERVKVLEAKSDENAESKGDLTARIDELAEQVAEIESIPPSPSFGADDMNFARQFEDIWETQTNLVQLQKKIAELEQRQAENFGIPGYGRASYDESANESDLEGIRRDQKVLTERLDDMVQWVEAIKSVLEDFKRRTEGMVLVPAEQSSATEHRIAELEARLDGIDEVVADGMLNIPKVTT